MILNLSMPILGDPGAIRRDDAIFLGERHFWCDSIPVFQGLKSPWALFLTKRVPEKLKSVSLIGQKNFSGQSAGRISTTSGTRLVRKSAQGLFSP